MKIVDIKAAGLRGATPEGGWANEIKPTDCVHTLITVLTDEGITGWGSVFTNDALEQERVSEKLHAHTFWLGRGGTLTHTISGIDIAMWDILGKCTRQPVGRLLGGRYPERAPPHPPLL